MKNQLLKSLVLLIVVIPCSCSNDSKDEVAMEDPILVEGFLNGNWIMDKENSDSIVNGWVQNETVDYWDCYTLEFHEFRTLQITNVIYPEADYKIEHYSKLTYPCTQDLEISAIFYTGKNYYNSKDSILVMNLMPTDWNDFEKYRTFQVSMLSQTSVKFTDIESGEIYQYINKD